MNNINYKKPEFSLVPLPFGKCYGRLYIPSSFKDIYFRPSLTFYEKERNYSNGDRVVYFTATKAEYRRLYRLYPNPRWSESTKKLL